MALMGLCKGLVEGKFHMCNGAVRHFPASRAMEHAPAVWELEGPIISGPNTSNILINAICNLILFFLQIVLQRLILD